MGSATYKFIAERAHRYLTVKNLICQWEQERNKHDRANPENKKREIRTSDDFTLYQEQLQTYKTEANILKNNLSILYTEQRRLADTLIELLSCVPPHTYFVFSHDDGDWLMYRSSSDHPEIYVIPAGDK